MNTKNFQTYFDCGFSKVRAGVFDKDNESRAFYSESKYLVDHLNLDSEIQKIISYFEQNTNEYINDINLMIDSPKMLSVGISVSKKLSGSKLRQEDVQFLIQEAKQLILKYHKDQSIIHIIIDNYKVNGIEYSYLPNEVECSFICLDILFICLPIDTIEYFKSFFLKSDISINQIFCSSYAKSINYKDNLNLINSVSFVDVGFNKTSIISYTKDKIVSLDVLPIGGNHITKDISKVLKIDWEQAENIKLNFDKDKSLINEKTFSLELVQKIIFARTEEILELCAESIKLNLVKSGHFKMVLMGEGSKILDNQYKDKIDVSNDIDFLEETTEDICYSAFRLGAGINKQEVVVIPKKPIKHGFFEKLFHLFR